MDLGPALISGCGVMEMQTLPCCLHRCKAALKVVMRTKKRTSKTSMGPESMAEGGSFLLAC